MRRCDSLECRMPLRLDLLLGADRPLYVDSNPCEPMYQLMASLPVEIASRGSERELNSERDFRLVDHAPSGPRRFERGQKSQGVYDPLMMQDCREYC